MIIKRLENQTDKTMIYDPSQKKVLFRFENGIFETDDEYIISFWNKHFAPVSDVEHERHDTEKPKAKKRGRPKKSVE